MSKKNKKNFQSFPSNGQPVLGRENEYTIIKHDLIRVVILNAVYFACLLALYYSNLKTHYLENWFSKILHF